MKKVIMLILIVGLCFFEGCMLIRVDVEPERQSGTVISVLKNIHIDPNGYTSDPEQGSWIGPWGMFKGGDESRFMTGENLICKAWT